MLKLRVGNKLTCPFKKTRRIFGEVRIVVWTRSSIDLTCLRGRLAAVFKTVLSRASKVAQQLLSGSSILRINVVLSYGIGLATFIAALVVRFSLDATIPHFPFITFIPAVVISAFLAGSRAGILCAVLSFLSAWFWFVDPMEPFSFGFDAVVALGLFAFVIAVDIAIIDAAARAVDGQHKIQIALEEALSEKEVLLYEVNHRVKNSLQLVSSVLLLEASKISNSEARSAVMVARNKVDMVSRLYQFLYTNGTHDRIDLKTALKDIVHHLILSAGRDDVNLDLSFSGDLMMNIRQATPLALAVNEIITNSLKYGLSSKQPKLTVTVNNVSNEMTLVIRDNGPGIAAITPDKRPGMGSEIVTGLVSQMRGTLVVHSDGTGTANVLTVPLYS